MPMGASQPLTRRPADFAFRVLLVAVDGATAGGTRDRLAVSPALPVSLDVAAGLGQAIDRLGADKPDVLLVDLIGAGTGPSRHRDAVDRLHAAAPAVPIVALVHDDAGEPASLVAELGVDEVLRGRELAPEGLARTVRHVEARHRVEAALIKALGRLHTSRRRFRALVDENADGIVVVRHDGRVHYVNPAAETLLQGRADEWLRSLFGRPLAAGDRIDAVLETPSGPRTVEVSVAETVWEEGGDESHLATLRDVTAHRDAERLLRDRTTELDRSNRELEQFAYVVSHDLQEPLRTISSYVGLIARRFDGHLDEDARTFVHFAVDGAERMKEMIAALLAFSRVGREPAELRAVGLDAVVDRAVRQLGHAVERTRAIVTRDTLPGVRGDERLLVQLFQNLIGNGI